MRPVVSFDIGGVISHDPDFFRPIMAELAQGGSRVIVVTAIGYGEPGRWGFTEQARYATSAERLIRRGLKNGSHWHDLFVTPDWPNPNVAGKYKDYVLREQGAGLHIDDNPDVIAQIKACQCMRYHPGADREPFKKELLRRANSLK